jgi:hypothetical protein
MTYYQTRCFGYGRGKGLRGRGKQEQEKYAYLSSVAYGLTPTDRDAKLKQFKLDADWAVDHDASTPDVAVLHNSKTKQVVHSIAGTRIDSKKHRWRDLQSDLGIVLGTDRYGGRTKQVGAVVKAARDKYKDYTHELSGHSLGGKVASNLSKETGLGAIVFNKGSSPLSSVVDHISKLFGRDHKDSKVTHYTTNKGGVIDPLSLSTTLLGNDDVTKKIETVDPSKGAHALGGFAIGAGKKKLKGGCSCNSPIREPKCTKKKSPSPWVAHVKSYAVKHGVSYKEALKGSSASYKR